MKVALRKDLAPLKIAADASIRRQAEERRTTFITPGAGKAMAYQQKAAEAEAFLRSDTPADPEAFPHVYGEAAATGVSPAEMAFIIVSLKRRWQTASAIIEMIEREALIQLAFAATPAAIEAAVAIDWSAVVPAPEALP